MSTRRASTLQSERKSLGEPYKIYSEITNAGKNIQGSKKHIRWLFGFSEAPGEYEVKLVHSLVSGKKTVWENGIEIVQSSTVLASDFSHGWSSRDTGRLYRIEVNLGIDAEYIFSIDGVRFDDLPNKPPLKKKVEAVEHNNSRYGTVAETSSSTAANRRSSGAAATTKPLADSNRSSFQSPVEKSKSTANEFDPFAAGAEPFDPFGNTSSASSSRPTSTNAQSFDPFGNNSSASSSRPTSTSTQPKPSPVKPSTPGFGRTNTSPAPVKATQPSSSAAASIFGAVDEPTNDPFATKTSSLSSFDAFGGTSDPFAPTIPQTMTGASRASTNSNLEWGSTTSSVAAFDAFNNNSHEASNNDPFGSTTASAGSSASVNPFDHPAAGQYFPSTQSHSHSHSTTTTTPTRASRRASAAEIAMDFTGLTIAPEPPKMSAPRDVPPPAPVAPPEPMKTEEETTIDPWASNLVDLDLSGKAAAQRRSSQLGGPSPSLNNLMGQPVQPPTQTRRASVNPQELLNSMNDPFGAPAGVLSAGAPSNNNSTYNNNNNMIPQAKPFNSAQAISSIGTGYGAPPPVAFGGNGMGMGMNPTGYGNNNNGSMMMGGGVGGMPGSGPGRSSMIMSQPPVGAGMGGGYGVPPNGNTMSGIPTNPRASFIANTPPQAPYQPPSNQPKSSLDSLDWRA